MHDQLDLLHRRLEQNPDDPECVLALASEYARLGHDTQAIAHLDLATTMEPSCAAAWVQKAACQHRARDTNGARHSLEEAIHLANENSDHESAYAAAALARQMEES
jgi:Flp pilus assembly protein TadD